MKIRQILLAAATVAATTASHAGVLLSEGFDNVSTLAGSGWVIQNQSTSGGSTSWFQGNTGIFGSHSGAANSYIAANFNNAPTGGSISNWLITPEVSLSAATTLDVMLRVAGEDLLDTLEVYYSANGASTNVGDFSLLGSYSSVVDEGWVQLQLALGALGGTGRFAVRYVVGDTSVDGNYVGVDSLSVTTAANTVPVPASLPLAALALATLALQLRRRT